MSKGEQTRRTILEAAIARFGRDGYRVTSVADITRDAGLGGSVAYAYFTNKEALFLAAADEDASAVIAEGVNQALEGPITELPGTVIVAVTDALHRHPLAERLFAGLEPEVTGRVLDIPALADVRKRYTERLQVGQLEGTVRPDIDPARAANGLTAITLALLMSVVQLGESVDPFAEDVVAVLEAAVAAVAVAPNRPPGSSSRGKRLKS